MKLWDLGLEKGLLPVLPSQFFKEPIKIDHLQEFC